MLSLSFVVRGRHRAKSFSEGRPPEPIHQATPLRPEARSTMQPPMQSLLADVYHATVMLTGSLVHRVRWWQQTREEASHGSSEAAASFWKSRSKACRGRHPAQERRAVAEAIASSH
jgi:hypothetical protein